VADPEIKHTTSRIQMEIIDIIIEIRKENKPKTDI